MAATTVNRRDPADELALHPGTRARVVGTSAEVAELLHRAHTAGRLVTMTPPSPARRGLVAVSVQLTPLPAASWWTRGRVAAAVAAATVLGGGAVALVMALRWIAAHPAQFAAGLLVAGLLLVAAGRSSICRGIVVHCRGCKG